jgi:hypothetical protein
MLGDGFASYDRNATLFLAGRCHVGPEQTGLLDRPRDQAGELCFVKDTVDKIDHRFVALGHHDGLFDPEEIVRQQAIARVAGGEFGEPLTVGAVHIDGAAGEPFDGSLDGAGAVAAKLGGLNGAGEELRSC